MNSYVRTDNPCYDTMCLLCSDFFNERDLSVFVHADPQRVSALLDVAERRKLVKKEDYIELNKRLRYYISHPEELKTNIYTAMADDEFIKKTKESYDGLFSLISGEKYYEEFKNLKVAASREQKRCIDNAVLGVMAADILANIAQKKDDYALYLQNPDQEEGKTIFYKKISFKEAKKNAIEKIEIFSRASESNPGWYKLTRNNVKRFACTCVGGIWYGSITSFSDDLMQGLEGKKADFYPLSEEVRDKKYHDFLVALKADKEEENLLRQIRILKNGESSKYKNVEFLEQLRADLEYKTKNFVANSGLELSKMVKMCGDFYKLSASLRDKEDQKELLWLLFHDLTLVKLQKIDELYKKVLKDAKMEAKDYLTIANDSELYNKIAAHLKREKFSEKQLEAIENDLRVLIASYGGAQIEKGKGMYSDKLRFVTALKKEAGRRRDGVSTT